MYGSGRGDPSWGNRFMGGKRGRMEKKGRERWERRRRERRDGRRGEWKEVGRRKEGGEEGMCENRGRRQREDTGGGIGGLKDKPFGVATVL